MKSLALILSAAMAFSSGAAQHDEGVPVIDVTISELISKPNFYNNAIVRVKGAAVARFEEEYICESDSDIGNEGGHCLGLIAVIRDGRLGPLDPDLYHNKIVLLTGVFDKDYAVGTLHGGIAPIRAVVIGRHNKGNIPTPPPEPSANNSFKPTPLRGAA